MSLSESRDFLLASRPPFDQKSEKKEFREKARMKERIADGVALIVSGLDEDMVHEEFGQDSMWQAIEEGDFERLFLDIEKLLDSHRSTPAVVVDCLNNILGGIYEFGHKVAAWKEQAEHIDVKKSYDLLYERLNFLADLIVADPKVLKFLATAGSAGTVLRNGKVYIGMLEVQ